MPLNQDYRPFTHRRERQAQDAEIVAERWSGSSGLYGIQVGLYELKYHRVIACGIPMDARPHFFNDKGWGDCYAYRQGWNNAVDEIGGSVRSMSGWTMSLLGKPDEHWIKETPHHE